MDTGMIIRPIREDDSEAFLELCRTLDRGRSS